MGSRFNTEMELETYPFVLPQISIFVICRRQVRSRRAYCQRSLCMEVLRFDRQLSIPTMNPPSTVRTHLYDLVQLGMIFLLLQSTASRSSRCLRSRRSLRIRSQINTGSCPLQRLVSMAVHPLLVVGGIASVGSAPGWCTNALVHVKRACLLAGVGFTKPRAADNAVDIVVLVNVVSISDL